MKTPDTTITACVVALTALTVTGCPDPDGSGTFGESDRVWFGPWPFEFAAFGASYQFTTEPDLILSSSDPSVLTIPTGGSAIETGAPGEAHLIASTELEGEIDRIRVDVRRPTHLEIDGRRAIFVGHASLLSVERWDQATRLAGCGGLTATGGGVVSVRTAEEWPAEIEAPELAACGNTFLIGGEARGSGEVTLQTGDVTRTHAFRVVGLEDIDAIEELSHERYEDGAVSIWVHAMSAGESVEGAPACAWTVSGGTLQDEWETGGDSAASFLPTSSTRMTATCTIGSASQTFEL